MKHLRYLTCAVVVVALGAANALCAEDKPFAQVKMEIKPHQVDCFGPFKRKCVVVRENGGDWGNFYSAIEGFKYEEGYWYELQVDKYKVPNPPADGSSIRFVMTKLISKTKESEKKDAK